MVLMAKDLTFYPTGGATVDEAWDALIADLMDDLSEAHDDDREIVEKHRPAIEALIRETIAKGV